MKKLLLLLMAFLLFAPPRVSAKVGDEKKLTFIDGRKNYKFWSTNSTTTAYSNAGNDFFYYKTTSLDWANVVKNTTTMPSKVTHLKYEAPVGTSGSTSGNIITEDGLQLKSAPTTILDYLPSTNNPIVLTGTESGGNTTLTYSYSGTATTTGYIGLNGNYSIQPTESKLTISIENGWIKAVDIYDSSQDESYKAVLEPGEGTKTATAETGFTHRFEADGESRTIQIKNNTTSYGAKISKMVITFVEGLPPAPTTPTADLFQAVSSLYGSYDADKAELTFNAQTTGILRIPNYADITGGKTLKDANGLAYTLKEGAELPTRAQVKATTAELAAANAATDWVMVNKTSGTDRLITLPIECLPEDGDLESWSKKLRVIAISDNDVSPEALTINLKMKRIDAPTVNIERTNAYTNPQSYNPATNELTYEKHTPTVYFDVLETYSNKNVGAKYKIDNGNENSFNFLDTQTSAPATVSASVNNNPGYGQLPVKNGTVNEIKVRHTAISTGYTANGNTQSEKKTYTDVNKGGWFVVKTRSVSSNFDPIPAPVVTVSDNVVDLGGGAKGYVTLPEITVTEADDKNDGILLFQISTGFDAEPKDPQGFADWTVVMNGTTNALANTLKQNGFTEGRIFFKEYKAGETSNYSYIDLYKIESTGLTDISYATLTSEDAPIANGSVVTVAGPLYVRGAYVSTNQSAAGYDSYILFVTDKNGNALRINGEYKSGTGFKDIIGSEDKNLVLASVTGVLKGQDKGYPELYLTDTRDYTPLLGKPTPGSEAAPEAETTFSLEKKDFSKLMLFTNFTYKGDETFADRDGNLVKIYHRIGSSNDWDEITNYLDENVTYRVLGYLGYAPEGLVIMPLDAVPGLRLLAPNPINPEAAPGEFIEMNVISPSLTLTANLDGVDDEGEDIATIEYVISNNLSVGGVEITKDNFQTAWIDKLDWSTATSIKATESFVVNAYRLGNGGALLAARLVSPSGLASGIVTVRFNKIDVPADNHLGTIAEFKAKYADGLPLPDLNDLKQTDYIQFTGKAQVREVTPTYLYVRDLPEEGKEFTEDELSSHSIIIYNKDGWDWAIAMDEKAPVTAAEGDQPAGNDDNAARALRKGDIITNFAMIADRTSLQNLRVNATGFARTFRRVEGDYVSYEVPVKNAQSPETTAFGESDRMLRYTVEAVQISRDGDGSEADPYVYTLDMPGNPVINNGGVFEELTGWDKAWDATKLYDVNGVVIRNGDKGNYAIALTSMPVPNGVEQVAAPEITLTGVGVNADDMSFLTEAMVEISYTPSDVATLHTVYYTKDGSDPRFKGTEYTGPVFVDDNTVIKAYVVATGAPNSEVTEAYLTRTSMDSRYVINFILNAKKDVPYHFTGNVRVAAKGGEYLFVRGTQGHYLPINIKNNAIDLNDINENDYISDMVITPNIAGDIVRGALITEEYGALFRGSSSDRPSDLAEDIEIAPDSVTELTVDNARRFVKLSGVTLTGFKIEAEGTDSQAADQWILKQGDGKRVRVDHNVLKPEFDFETIKPNARYNVTGFAMLTADGKDIELWPTKVEEIKTTASVDAVFTGNLLNTPEKVDNSYEVEFYPYTTVELNVPGAGNATIYYYIADTDESLDDDSKVKWNEYAQPFPVIKSCYIHAKAIRPGYEESVHTHIDFTLAQPAGTVEFDVDPQTGKTVVTMTAAEGAEIYWTEDNTAPLATWEKYTGPVPFTQATRIWAYAKEGGKTGTPVSMYVMIQPEGDTTVKDPAQVSGKPVITHRLTEDKTPMITIQPEDESLAEGTYTIHYTTDGRTPTVNSTVYTGEFAMPKEGGLVLAILKENAKQHPSDVAHLNVSYIPTDIDGIDSDRNGSDVRAEGDSIIAPEGSEVYDINGRRVAATGLRSGIYIVKVPGAKAVKVKVD